MIHELGYELIGNGKPTDSDIYLITTISIEGYENDKFKSCRELLD